MRIVKLSIRYDGETEWRTQWVRNEREAETTLALLQLDAKRQGFEISDHETVAHAFPFDRDGVIEWLNKRGCNCEH